MLELIYNLRLGPHDLQGQVVSHYDKWHPHHVQIELIDGPDNNEYLPLGRVVPPLCDMYDS